MLQQTTFTIMKQSMRYDFNVTTDYSFYNRDNATINANDFNVTLTGNSYSDFHNEDSATINADNFNVTAAGNYSDFHI